MSLTTSEPEQDRIMEQESDVARLMESEHAYSSELGSAFQGNSRELLEELPDNSIDLIVTSPPFALQHKKEYGNEDQEGYNDWFMSFIPEVRRVLQPHGSFVVEIGGAFKKGYPERSEYQFNLLSRLVDEDEGGMHLAQDFYWYNPAKLPNPIEWVNVRKIRVTDAVTHIWWLTPNINKDSAVEDGEHPHPEASNQRVLQEYSASQKELLETGEYNDGKRSSGWNIDSESFANDNDGSIPDNLIEGFKSDDVLESLDEFSAKEFIELISNQDIEEVSAGQLLGMLGMGGRTPDNVIEASNTASNTHYLSMCREVEELREKYRKDKIKEIESIVEKEMQCEIEIDIDTDIGNDENVNDIVEINVKKQEVDVTEEDALNRTVDIIQEQIENGELQLDKFREIESHPARFPRQIPEFFIDFLTPNPPYNDWDKGVLDSPVVLDIFAGSNLTGMIAEKKKRHWIAFEKEQNYIETSEFRFRTEEEIKSIETDDQKSLGEFPTVGK